ncbi:MAG: DEDD exonuclease domain-containing protein [Actinomycetales bacterium]|nr:DEDD exonuclease domain-containing protein [Actinomycetales bacterium]
MTGQLRLDDLGTPLSDATFVILDLETTGGSPAEAGITEIGAVKVQAGQVIGEFASLVNPGSPIPAYIAALTGITDTLVANAPPLAAVLPGLLEFIRGAVLVAHNAPYDVGFLKGACARHEHPWPGPPVLDTARLARVCLHRDEVRNCKLATLATHFRTQATPSHRALDDARATTEVFHALLERAGSFGVMTVEDAMAFTSRVSAQQRTKRHLADGLPDSPGVYVFQDQQGTALYVGRSRSIRRRVRTYFTASETRRRMTEMIAIATRVQPIACATDLEARVREVRLIAAEQPRYNRASKRPHAQVWLALTAGHASRLSIVRRVTPAHLAHLGPFTSRQQAQTVAEAIAMAFGLRTCTTRMPARRAPDDEGCLAAALGQCLAPCRRDHQGDAYAAAVARACRALQGDASPVIDALQARMASAAEQARYEEAAAWRDRLACVVQASLRSHRRRSLARCGQLVAARPTAEGGWEAHCIRYGVLASAMVIPPGHDPRSAIEALISSAAQIDPPDVEITAGLDEEAGLILDWLDSGGVRLVVASTPLSMPIGCGGALAARLASLAGDSAIERHWSAGERPLGPPAGAVSRMRAAG